MGKKEGGLGEKKINRGRGEREWLPLIFWAFDLNAKQMA